MPATPSWCRCSARRGAGLDELRAALDRWPARLAGARRRDGGAARLHVDRSFTLRGRGHGRDRHAVVGLAGARATRSSLLPRGRRGARARRAGPRRAGRARARPGQRVALNLAGVEVARRRRAATWWRRPGAELRRRRTSSTSRSARAASSAATRVQVHHGTREAPARVASLGGRFRAAAARARRSSRPRATGWSCARSRRPTRSAAAWSSIPHARAPRTVAATCSRGWRGWSAASPSRRPAREPAAARGRARAAAPLAGLGAGARGAPAAPRATSRRSRRSSAPTPRSCPRCATAGRAVRVGRDLHFHPDALADGPRRASCAHRRATRARSRSRGCATSCGTTRKFAQALLEHFDGERVTLRRRRRLAGAAAPRALTLSSVTTMARLAQRQRRHPRSGCARPRAARSARRSGSSPSTAGSPCRASTSRATGRPTCASTAAPTRPSTPTPARTPLLGAGARPRTRPGRLRREPHDRRRRPHQRADRRALGDRHDACSRSASRASLLQARHTLRRPEDGQALRPGAPPGAYLRIVTEGELAAGDPIEVVHRRPTT